MYHRLLKNNLSRTRPFCLFGAKGVGKTTLIRDFADQFSNWIQLDLETAADRALIILDEIGSCPDAIRWASENGESKSPFIAATSSILTKELANLTLPGNSTWQAHFLFPLSFEEFLPVMNDPAAMEAFREVPVPYYAYEKLLNYFHLYALIGGMPEITREYADNHHLSGLKKTYERIEERLIDCLQHVTAGLKSLHLAVQVFQNAYPYAATRISFNRFGNLEKGSREISHAFKAIERIMFLQKNLPTTSATLPLEPDHSKFPRLQLLDTGMVNYFSGIQKSLFHSHDMNAIFEGQIARQVVGQEILAA
ncbi:MAG: hypothetical protein NTW16_13815 [Bacteroidetes bacterium]|nr:hypothetical protein [Bacteroidota bacterium]